MRGSNAGKEMRGRNGTAKGGVLPGLTRLHSPLRIKDFKISKGAMAAPKKEHSVLSSILLRNPSVSLSIALAISREHE
ncbi:hypothetical protein VTI28DRAFT_6208 [Corynascus sepedonium]